MNKSKVTLLNVVSSFFLQIITIVSGFIIPKIILFYFGSEVNGLISSLTQFLNYISLVEGGVTTVISANLYKPLIEKNEEKISSIVKTADKFYKRIGLIFIIYSIVIATIYPIIFHSSFSYIYIFTLTIILAMSLFIQYMFSLSLKTLLMADKKIYIVSISQIVIVILNIVLSIISVKVFPNVHIFKFINGILFVIQPIVYNYYVKKHYKINKDVNIDNSLIKERWNGFAINIAAFIHFSTDITILTVFTDLRTVSVYSVYALVTTGLRQIVSSITNGLNPALGQSYAKNDEKDLNKKLDLYEYIVFLLVFLLFTMASLLISPFVMIYTKGVNDVNYYQPLFGILIVISEAIYLLKFPHLNLSYVANKFKEITIPAYLEAGINIVLSVILVPKFGLIGVCIGTIVAMLYRMIFHVYYTKKMINSRKQKIFYKKLVIFLVSTILGVLCCVFFISDVQFNLLNWVWHGIIYFVILILIYFVISVIFFKKELLFIKKYLLKK